MRKSSQNLLLSAWDGCTKMFNFHSFMYNSKSSQGQVLTALWSNSQSKPVCVDPRTFSKPDTCPPVFMSLDLSQFYTHLLILFWNVLSFWDAYAKTCCSRSFANYSKSLVSSIEWACLLLPVSITVCWVFYFFIFAQLLTDLCLNILNWNAESESSNDSIYCPRDISYTRHPCQAGQPTLFQSGERESVQRWACQCM